jgi:hypothetical protein
VAAAGLSIALIVGPALSALADDDTGPPAHVLAKAKEGLGLGQARALEMQAVASTRDHETGVPAHAQGEPGHVTGLERAQQSISDAVEKIKGWQKDHPGNGNAYGRGHAADVHAALRAELQSLSSPSELPSHGQVVSDMVKALEKFTDEKPGRGLGRDNKGTDGDD